MNIQELLNRTDRFAANAGCRITEVDAQHACGRGREATAEREPARGAFQQQGHEHRQELRAQH